MAVLRDRLGRATRAPAAKATASCHEIQALVSVQAGAHSYGGHHGGPVSTSDRGQEAQGRRVAAIVANTCVNDSRVLKEAEALAAAGYRVRVFCLAGPGLPEIEVKGGVEYERIERPWKLEAASKLPARGTVAGAPPKRPPGAQRPPQPESLARRLKVMTAMFLDHELNAWTFQRHVKRFAPHIVHAHDFNVLPVAVRAARGTGARVVYDMHELEEGRFGLDNAILRRWKSLIECRCLRNVSATITVSPSIAVHHAKKYGRPLPTLVLNAPRVDLARPGGAGVRSACGLDAQAPLAVYVGKVSPGRGVELILEALLRLPGMHLAIVGTVDPGLEWAVDRYLHARALRGRLHFPGPVPSDEVVPFIRSADLGICTILNSCLNYEYCLPNKLFEMTFAGLPLVVSGNIELKGFVAATGTGVAAGAHTAEAIAGAVRHVFAARATLRPSAAKLAELYKKYGWPRQQERLLDLYRDLSSPRGSSRRREQTGSPVMSA